MIRKQINQAIEDVKYISRNLIYSPLMEYHGKLAVKNKHNKATSDYHLAKMHYYVNKIKNGGV